VAENNMPQRKESQKTSLKIQKFYVAEIKILTESYTYLIGKKK